MLSEFVVFEMFDVGCNSIQDGICEFRTSPWVLMRCEVGNRLRHVQASLESGHEVQMQIRQFNKEHHFILSV